MVKRSALWAPGVDQASDATEGDGHRHRRSTIHRDGQPTLWERQCPAAPSDHLLSDHGPSRWDGVKEPRGPPKS